MGQTIKAKKYMNKSRQYNKLIKAEKNKQKYHKQKPR